MILVPVTVRHLHSGERIADELRRATSCARLAFRPTCVGLAWNKNYAWNRILPVGGTDHHLLYTEDGQRFQFQKLGDLAEPWEAARDLAFSFDELQNQFVTWRQFRNARPADALILRRNGIVVLHASQTDFGDEAELLLLEETTGHEALDEIAAIKRDLNALLDFRAT